MKTKNSTDISRLIEDNQGLVYHLVAQIIRKLPVRHDYDDLVGYGMVGLVEAAKKYDGKRGVGFATFAFPRINGAIYDGISKLSWMSRSRFSRLIRVRNQAEADGNTLAAEQADMELSGMAQLDSGSEQLIFDDQEESADSTVEKWEEKEILAQLISELPNREQRLISMVYIDGTSLQSASQKLGISKSWASRMHTKVLTHLAAEIRKHDAS